MKLIKLASKFFQALGYGEKTGRGSRPNITADPEPGLKPLGNQQRSIFVLKNRVGWCPAQINTTRVIGIGRFELCRSFY